MKRRTFVAKIRDAQGHDIAETRTYAWNSGIRATEKLAGDHARSLGITLEGDKPDVMGKPATIGAQYRRAWRAGGIVVHALVRELDLFTCQLCGHDVDTLEKFPGDICPTCYGATPAASAPVTARELAQMWGAK